MGEKLTIRGGEVFKPSPQFRKLYYIYLVLVILLVILPWYIPALLSAPFQWKVAISIPLLAILIFIAYWISKYYDTVIYMLTENEIEWKKGVWFRNTAIVPYNRITNIEITQGPISRKLGIAALKIQTAGYSAQQAGAELTIVGVEQFEDLKELIMDFVRAKKAAAVETYEKDKDSNILEELVKIRELLEKALEK